MKTFKKIMAMVLTLTMCAGLMCACGKGEKNNGEIGGNDPAKIDVVEDLGMDPEIANKEVNVGQFVIIDPSANFSITSSSKDFKDTQDIVHVDTDEVESKGTPIIETLSHSGMIFIAKVVDGVKYGDIITVTPDEAEANSIQYSLRTGAIDLDVKADAVKNVSFLLGRNQMNVAGVSGEFSFDVMESIDNGSVDMSIDMSVAEASDVEIYKEGESYFVSSSTPIEGMMVRVMKMDIEDGDDMQMADINEASNKYEIKYTEDGLTINMVA